MEGEMELVTLHRRVVEHWAARVASIGKDQWGDPTPCTEWSVRDLVNHVVGEELWTAPLLRGRTIAEVGNQFDGDVLGDDPLRTAQMAADEAVTVVDEIIPGGGTPSTPRVVTFKFTAPTKAGKYQWFCAVPCDPWAMAHNGYMRGFVTVTA